MTTNLLAAALELVDAGWTVFPCEHRDGPRAKAPLLLNGHRGASADPEQVRTWWTTWPHALIGCPVPDTLLVLDIDPRNGGNLYDLQALVGALPETLTVWSGRGDGGRHLYLRRPPGEFTSTKLPAGVDLKVNGYTIVPPSPHPSTGRPYRWDQCPIAAVPARLRELLRPPARPLVRSPSGGSGRGLIDSVAKQQRGNINRGLYWAACRAAEEGIIDRIADDLVAAAVAAGEDEAPARRTIDSARKAYAA